MTVIARHASAVAISAGQVAEDFTLCSESQARTRPTTLNWIDNIIM
jgi:hypothetical protein